jgi:hypothetical protein
MGGKEAIVRLRALDPKVKAIVSSGYANDLVRMANEVERAAMRKERLLSRRCWPSCAKIWKYFLLNEVK